MKEARIFYKEGDKRLTIHVEDTWIGGSERASHCYKYDLDASASDELRNLLDKLTIGDVYYVE